MFKTIAKRCFSCGKLKAPKVCIVGAGPAGFYAAQHLHKKLVEAEIDIIERLPVPFGLVRFGVAPDHHEVKNVIHTFTKTAEAPNVKFYGNIELGKDVSLEELRQCYHIVLLTYGAEKHRQLNIPGETLDNVIPAREIVGWYNGVPSDRDLQIDLSGDAVAIIGQGNVAVDVARMLLSHPDELKNTDITEYSLSHLAQSKVQRVHLIGRRGPLQAAYTIKELREMLKLKNCRTVWRKDDFQVIPSGIVETLPRPKKRITELMLKSVETGSVDQGNSSGKVFNPVFLRSPLEILGKSSVEKLVLCKNRLTGQDYTKQVAVATDSTDTLDCSMVIPSIGYQSKQADPNIPFDFRVGVVNNVRGKIGVGLYTSGWLATGPVGVILSTMSDAFGVAELIIEDAAKENIFKEPRAGFAELKVILNGKHVQVVEWEGWKKIDEFEVAQGAKVSKPREKVVDIRQMLEIAA